MKPTLHQTPTRTLHPALGALLSALLLCALPGNGYCEDPDNLLKNAAPEEPGMETKVPDWMFQKGEEQDPGTIEAGTEEIRDGLKESYFFYIRKTTQSSKDHVWWRQDVGIESDTPPTYELTFEAKASGDTDYGVYAGVAYIGADASFEYQNLATVSREAPNAKLIPATDWREFRKEFTPPPGTVKLVMRFGMDAQNPAECGFRNIVLKELK